MIKYLIIQKQLIIRRKNHLNYFWKKSFLFFSILTFIFTSITVEKTFYLRNIIDNANYLAVEIDEKESSKIILKNENNYADDTIKDIAASEFVNCINSPTDINKLPDSVTSVIKEINDYYNRSNNYFAFKYQDISIIFADNPYILVALSNLGQTDYYMSYFNKVNDLTYKLHTEYWKYKMNTCGKINQYQ